MKKDAIIDLLENDLREIHTLVETFREPERIASAFLDLLRQKHDSLGKEIALLEYWATEAIGTINNSQLIINNSGIPGMRAGAIDNSQLTIDNSRVPGAMSIDNSQLTIDNSGVRSPKRDTTADFGFAAGVADPTGGKTDVDEDSGQASSRIVSVLDEIAALPDEMPLPPAPESKQAFEQKTGPEPKTDSESKPEPEPKGAQTEAPTATGHGVPLQKPRQEQAERVTPPAAPLARPVTPTPPAPPTPPRPAAQKPAPATTTGNAQKAADIVNYGTPVDDIRKALSINDRILFQRELFGGNKLAYEAAVETVNAAASYAQAYEYFRQTYHWDESDPATEAFLRAVHRRFL